MDSQFVSLSHTRPQGRPVGFPHLLSSIFCIVYEKDGVVVSETVQLESGWAIHPRIQHLSNVKGVPVLVWLWDWTETGDGVWGWYTSAEPTYQAKNPKDAIKELEKKARAAVTADLGEDRTERHEAEEWIVKTYFLGPNPRIR